MIPRQLEPEVMDTQAEAVDYNTMDHGEVNRLFVDDLLEWIPSEQIVSGDSVEAASITVLDLGTGTALIPMELCSRTDFVKVVAVDMAVEMLKLAQENIKRLNLENRIFLELTDAKNLSFSDHTFDVVVANSLIHHIPDPILVFRELIRVLKFGGLLFLRDLARPNSIEQVNHLVDSYAGQANHHQQQLLRDSLHAALTFKEVQGLLEELSLPKNAARMSSDRHWTVSLTLPRSS